MNDRHDNTHIINKNAKNGMTDIKNLPAAKENSKKGKRTPKQIAALICVILLASVYLLTLLAACLDFPGSDKMFAACLYATIGLPILLWLYIWLYGVMKDRREGAGEEKR